jgi:hypothetical protein
MQFFVGNSRSRDLSLELYVLSFGFSLVASLEKRVFSPAHAKQKMLIEK